MSISRSLVLRVAVLLSLAQFAACVAVPARCGPIRCAASSAPRRPAAALDRARARDVGVLVHVPLAAALLRNGRIVGARAQLRHLRTGGVNRRCEQTV